MAKVEIYYLLSESGRKASLAAGGDGKAKQCVTVTHDQPQFADALALARVGDDGLAVIDATAWLTYSQVGGSYSAERGEPRYYDSPVEADALIADERERRAAFKRWIAEARERDALRERERYENSVAQCLAAGAGSLIRFGQLDTSAVANDPRLAALRAEAQAILDRRAAEAKAKERAEAEAEERASQERADWIARHGSPRLRRAAAEGIECDSVYLDERLALERPGWQWSDRVCGSYADPRNPPAEAFDLLDAAREKDAAARLVYWTDRHEHDEDCEDREDCPKYDFAGYAAVGDFLGREIVYGLSGKVTA